MSYQFSISEQYRTDIPNIETPPDIDLEELATALGKTSPNDLVFDTRPIGKPITSRNNRKYGVESVKSLVRQVNEKRPEGRWGHLTSEEAGSRFESPPIRWVAAVYDETTQTGWGKYVALTEEAERYVKSSHALKSRMGTSIYAHDAKVNKDEVIEDYDLITIDLANAERLGIPSMATIPRITREQMEQIEEIIMTDANNKPNDPVVPPVTAPAVVTEGMDVKQMRLLIEGYQTDISRLTVKDNLLTTVCEQFGTTPENILETIRTFRTANSTLVTENKQLLTDYTKAAVDKSVVSETVRPVVTALVKDRNPATRAEVDKAIDTVLELEYIKSLLQAAVVTETGGKMPNNTQPNNQTTPIDMFE